MELDKKVALLGFLCGLAFLAGSLYINYGIGLATTITVSCLTYVLVASLGRKEATELSPVVNLKTQQRIRVVSFIMTAATMAYLLLSVSSFLYKRPLEYFIITASLSAIIAIEINLLVLDENKLTLYNILMQILFLGAGVRWSLLFAFPGFVGIDPWSDAFGVQHVLDTGHLSYTPQAPYGAMITYPFPFMHLLISEMQLLTGFADLKYALTFSVGIFEVTSLLSIFIMARSISPDVRQAALASLLVSVNTWHVKWGFWLIPMTMGLAMYPLVLNICHSSQEARTRVACSRRKMFATFTLLFGAMLFTHSISSLITVLSLATGWVGVKMMKRIENESESPQRGFFLLLATTMLLAYWTFSYFLESAIPYNIESYSLGPITSHIRSSVHFEIDNLGMYMLYFLSTLGGLTWLRRPNRLRFSIFSAALGLLAISYGSVLTGWKGTIPQRWLAFSSILLAPMAVDGYRTLESRVHKTRHTHAHVVLALLVFSLTFAMIISSDCNIDSPIYAPEEVSLASTFKNSEMRAAEVANSIFHGDIYVDGSYRDYFIWSLHRNVSVVDFRSLDPKNFSGLIVRRQYMYSRPTQIAGNIWVRKVDLAVENVLNEVNKIYTNEEVAVFYSLKSENMYG